MKEKENKVESEILEKPDEELSDDELYAKIQTEKLLKRKKIRKISTIVALCFVFALSVVMIVLGTVPFKLLPKCVNDDYYAIDMVTNGSNSYGAKHFTQGENGYKEAKKVIDSAFSQTYLSAIFSGSMFSYAIDEQNSNASSVIGDSGSLTTSRTSYLKLTYAEPRVLTKQNGAKYQSRYHSTNWNGELYFSNVYIEISSDEGVKTSNVYVVVSYPLTDGGKLVLDNEGNIKYDTKNMKIIKISVRADTSKISEKWDELLEISNN